MMMTLATSPQIHKVLTAFVFGVLFVASQGFKVAQFDYKAKGKPISTSTFMAKMLG